jgi:hypothetical protein
MKYVFNFLFTMFLSVNCFALQFKIVQPERGANKIQPAIKKDSCKRKTAKIPMAKELNTSNQKVKKETAEENAEFYGPLSWKPALLY